MNVNIDTKIKRGNKFILKLNFWVNIAIVVSDTFTKPRVDILAITLLPVNCWPFFLQNLTLIYQILSKIIIYDVKYFLTHRPL